ncbi:MAG: deoxyribose-phosphate aldolase, partial [Gemmatimonadota bacterium]|nr:deoxyribose-phosphate aldolase [Gemmatimonadota bacterium]
MRYDEAALERIIEQITHEVLVMVGEGEIPGPGPAAAETGNMLSAQNYVDRVQPVVRAGADRIASTLGVAPTDGSLSHMIDHTLLKPDATQAQVAQLCYEAKKCDFASVCVNPSHVKLCADLLKESEVRVCTVVGFPLGATSTETKAFEAQKAIRDGASEVDMVINVGALKSRDYELVQRDIASVARVCHAGGAILKVIIEAVLLSDEEKVAACLIV